MIRKCPNFRLPPRFAARCICGLGIILLVFANISSAAASGVGTMPGALEALGQPLKAITSTPSADLVQVGRKGKKKKAKKRARKRKKAARKAKSRRKAYKARKRRAAKRRPYKRRYYKRRYSRGPSIYLSVPLAVYPRYYGYRPYYTPYYYSYRPAYGRCARWRSRCSANWGYRTRSYYGCMRYHGCR